MEPLESRVVLYSASGNAWPAAQLVTISFMPDGTSIGGQVSNLQTKFNDMFGSTSAWQNTILKAAQAWAGPANINFEVVPDNGAAQGSGGNQQGDPGFGDIRISGYNFDSATLATAYMPPPVNNYSIAGDISFNTEQVFKNNGQTYDLFTVAAHEIGHALGLYHSTVSNAEEYATYNGAKPALSSDDIAGIRSAYGTRLIDSYDADGTNGTRTVADDITSWINSSTLNGVVTGLDITTISDIDYYKFTVPVLSSGTISIKVSSDGLSLLTPKVQILNSVGSVVAQDTANIGFGVSKTLNVTNVTPGQVYYIMVDGTENTTLGTGVYGIALNLGIDVMPTVPTPTTLLPNGDPISSGGGQAIKVDLEGRANSYTEGVQGSSPEDSRTVAMDNLGNYVIVWTSDLQDGDGTGIFARRFDAFGIASGPEFQVDSTSIGDQIHPTVAMAPDGSFTVAWSSKDQDGDGWGVYARRYNAAGTPRGAEFLVNTFTVGDQQSPSLATDATGGFVITWASTGQDGSGTGIFARRFDALGIVSGLEFQVNSSTTGDQSQPTIAMSRSGAFTVAWASKDQDGDGWGVYARRYNAAGIPLGGEFFVNSYIKGDQQSPEVALSDSGSLVITWASKDQDGSGWGVYARRYDAAGTPLGGEFSVNTMKNADQSFPSVAMTNRGDFLIAWASMSPDSSGWGVYAQHFAADGSRIGGEFLATLTTQLDQYYPTVAMDNLGHVVVTWSGNGKVGGVTDDAGVYFQRFTTKANSLIEDFGHDDDAPRGPQASRREAIRRRLREYREAGNRLRMKEIRRESSRPRVEPLAGRGAEPIAWQAIDALLMQGAFRFDAGRGPRGR